MSEAAVYLIVVFVLLFGSGSEQEFEDISSEDEYANLIGSEYESVQVLKLHGVTSDTNYKRVVSFYSLTSKPGISGPEIVFSRDLEVGSRIKVLKVMKCSNCLLGAPISLSVSITTEQLRPDAPVRLYRMTVKDSQTRKVELDPYFFRKL